MVDFKLNVLNDFDNTIGNSQSWIHAKKVFISNARRYK